MTAARKLKLSITLSADLVSRIDQQVDKASSRSSVIERMLQRAGRLRVADELEAATIAYYDGLDEEARADDDAIARAGSSTARKVLAEAGVVPAKRSRK